MVASDMFDPYPFESDDDLEITELDLDALDAVAKNQVGVAELAKSYESWRYGHVIVDEAQQLTPMQWRMVMRRTSNRALTILGDIAQKTTTRQPNESPSANWASVLPEALKDLEAIQLTVNYRSAVEFNELAEVLRKKIAPGLSESLALQHQLEPVSVVSCDGLVRCVETSVGDNQDASSQQEPICKPETQAISGTVLQSASQTASQTESQQASQTESQQASHAESQLASHTSLAAFEELKNADSNAASTDARRRSDSQVIATLKAWLQNTNERIAVIHSGKAASDISTALTALRSSMPSVSLAATQPSPAQLSFDLSRIEVHALEQIKGLEFDAVVVWDPHEIAAQTAGLNHLYIAITRARKRLCFAVRNEFSHLQASEMIAQITG